ncbi:MAG: glycoside hydrolase family 140 protein [Rhodothermales bacterium]
MRYIALSVVLLLTGCAAPPANPVASPGLQPLQISADQRYLEYADGTPFFWLGDTAWELFHRLDREEATFYLEDRAAKGFTVIQAVALAELDGLNTPNPYGHTPLIDNDPAQPNPAYFEHVDFIVEKANQLGMYIGMLPTWGDKFNLKWGVGPVVFTEANAAAYGTWIAERYRDDDIIWITGGDRNPETPEQEAIVRSMAEAIDAVHGGAQLMTYHPMGGFLSSQWFQDDPWLDFNMYQSGHGRFDNPNYQMTERGYALTPTKPVLDGEPRYEDHPVNWNPDEGWFMDFDTRQAAYWPMLSGAMGHTYGNHNIWQMWQPGRDPISSARTPWREAVGHIGSAQVGYMRQFFEARPWTLLRPATNQLQGDNPEGPMHQRMAVAEDGSYLVAYSPYGTPLTLDLRLINAANHTAYWFDPRTGTSSEITELPLEGTHTFTPPGMPERGNDWVLLVEDASQEWAAP